MIIDNYSTGNTVEGNYVGTDATGSHGAEILSAYGFSPARPTTRGGRDDSAARNVISANAEDGVQID